jgi:hypothetical protein
MLQYRMVNKVFYFYFILNTRLELIRREIIYCKRAILSLSSSKILTPIPLSARRMCTPRLCWGGGGEDTLARRRGGWGVMEDERDRIALLQ